LDFSAPRIVQFSSIYGFGTDYLLLIFPVLSIVTCAPALLQPGCERLAFATTHTATIRTPESCTTQAVRTSFAVGVRQPAGTIHQYLAKFQNIPKQGGTE
jgi:hypothetical protein